MYGSMHILKKYFICFCNQEFSVSKPISEAVKILIPTHRIWDMEKKEKEIKIMP